MIAIVAIAIAAGCASALMFASISSGALISLVLFYLAPLPLMVTGLGWGPLAATIGGIAAATGLGAMFGVPYCIAFSIMVALPAWWLGHLALLGRPAADVAPPMARARAAAAPVLEWYPVGRILLWVAGFAVLTTMAALLTLGGDAASITEALKRGLQQLLNAGNGLSSAEFDRLISAMVMIAPATAAMITMTTLTLNLFLAAKITATSGRLKRPWPDLSNVTLPPMTLAGLCTAMAFAFTGGLLAIASTAVAVTLLMGYAFTGFAALHTLTLALKNRAVWLGVAYTVVVVFVWPIAAVIILGLVDAMFGLRRRFRQGRPPPLPTT